LKFLGEVWARRTCVGANQQELTTCAKSRGLKEKKILHRVGLGHLGEPATSGPTPGLVQTIHFYFIYFLNLFFGSLGNGPRLLGEWVQPPQFLKLAPTLGSVKCSIPHGNWKFHFFSNFIFAKFRVYLDLHIHHWNFCFMKIFTAQEIH
jgi:hypothetical protein